VSFRVIPVAFPLLLPIVTRGLRFAALLEHVLTSALAVFAIVGFLSFAPTLRPDITASQTGLASKLFNAGNRLAGDANAYGSVLLNSVKDGRVVDFTWLDSDKYASLVGQQPVRRDEFDYVIADTTNKPIITLSWGFLEPWTQHFAEILRNPDLDQIYDSENLAVFQPTGKALSAYQLRAEDVGLYSGVTDDWGALWLCLVLLALFFLPGAILIFIASRHLIAIVDSLRVLCGLAVGLSVTFVTFVGYLTNFSPLGLVWFVPLSFGIPCVALLAEWILHRRQSKLSSSFIAYAASLVTVVLVWAFLATGVGEARASRRAEYTEFFATRDSGQTGTITLNVVNRLAEPQDFAIVVQSLGQPGRTIGVRILAPGAIWRSTWETPVQQTHERFVISLERDGVAYRELRLSSSAP
jgi:hypothetical protein